MKRSKHNLRYTRLLSCDLGELVPVGLTEVLPGDSFRHSTSVLIRAAAMLAPVMHPVDVRIHHWFVPHRLVWSNWENFITGGPDGLNASVFPTITIGGGSGAANGSLADYLGVPTGVNNIVVSALPFRGAALIFNEWYRDQDLVTPLVVSTADGNDTTTSLALQNVAWEKDYFTSARPWEMKGPAVNVPVGGSAPVNFSTNDADYRALRVRVNRSDNAVQKDISVIDANNAAAVATFGAVGNFDSNSGYDNQPLYPSFNGFTGATANLAGASSVSVNTLRQALAIQRFQEARGKYGSRYPEYLAALGVRSSDGRLQRPEFLGGGRQRLQFSEVLQTAADGANPVATMRGHGIAAIRSNAYQRFFEEHGYVYTFLSVKPKTIYANGLFRHWNRRTKLDYWQRELEHIGQQPVARKEVYAAAASPDGVFGYQDRYDEYRRSESSVHGEFRASTLDFWHFARLFASEPTLNSSFVTSIPAERAFAVPSADVLYVHAKHDLVARRLVSREGTSFIF